MNDSRHYRVYPSSLNLRTAYAGVYDHLQRSGYTEWVEKQCQDFTICLSDDRTLSAKTTREFLSLLDQYPTHQSTYTLSLDKKG